MHYRGWRICQVNQGVLLALHGAFRGCSSHGSHSVRQEPADVGGRGCLLLVAVRQDVADDEARRSPIQRMWLLEMARKKFGYTRRTIHPAPDAWVLKKFGGELTIEEFRNYTGKHEPCETIPPTASADGNGRGARRSVGCPSKAFGDSKQCSQEEKRERQEGHITRLLERQPARGEAPPPSEAPCDRQKKKATAKKDGASSGGRQSPGRVHEEVYVSKP